MPRYVLGPYLGPLEYLSQPPDPADKTDLIPSLVSASPKEIILSYPPHDPEAVNVPARTFAFLLPEGAPAPSDAQGWVDSGHPIAIADAPIPPEGVERYEVPPPVAPLGNYLGQIVLEFAE